MYDKKYLPKVALCAAILSFGATSCGGGGGGGGAAGSPSAPSPPSAPPPPPVPPPPPPPIGGGGYTLAYFRAYAPPPGFGSDLAVYTTAGIGDVTGDGRSDVVTLVDNLPEPPYKRLYVLPQGAAGDLGPAITYPIPELPYPWQGVLGATLADMNNDGTKDVVVTRSGSVHFALSDGGGRLYGHSELVTDSLMVETPAAVADMNNDGNLDVLVHTSIGYGQMPSDPSSRLEVLLGDGKGAFKKISTVSGIPDFIPDGDPQSIGSVTARSIATGDFNGDGNQDVAIQFKNWIIKKQMWEYPLKVYLGKGDGTFQLPYTVTSNPQITRIVGGDLDADGRTDIVAVDYEAVPSVARIWLYRQVPDGSISSMPLQYQSYVAGASVDVADLNGDGRSDLVVAFDGQEKIGYYLQNNGYLHPYFLDVPMHPSARFGPSSVGIGDFNGDGCKDVALAATYGGLFLLRGSGCVR